MKKSVLFLFAFFAWVLIVPNLQAQEANCTITTVAGNGHTVFSGDGGPALVAGLDSPSRVAVDSRGNLYIGDYRRIRKVEASTGIITTTVGGGAPGFSGDGGPAIDARLDFPSDIAVDGAGNLYMTDLDNRRIRKVEASTGIITTVAGTGVQGDSGDGDLATNASLGDPDTLAVNSAGDIYIVGIHRHRVRKVEASTGIITTIVGDGTPEFSGDGGPAIDARLDWPSDLAVDSRGNLYIGDANNHRIRKVEASTGIITTIAGNGHPGFSGDGGPAIDAELRFQRGGLAVDSRGNLYIGDLGNERIRKVEASTGIITTVAGNGHTRFSGDGGPAIDAQLSVSHVAVDSADNLYIADLSNDRIRKVTCIREAPRPPARSCLPTDPSCWAPIKVIPPQFPELIPPDPKLKKQLFISPMSFFDKVRNLIRVNKTPKS